MLKGKKKEKKSQYKKKLALRSRIAGRIGRRNVPGPVGKYFTGNMCEATEYILLREYGVRSLST